VNYCLNVLVAPAQEVLSDNDGSERSWSYNLMNYVSESFPVSFYAICGKAELNKKLKNTTIFEVAAPHSVGLLSKAIFIFKYHNVATKILKRNTPHIDLVHHLFPLGFKTGFNPLAVLNAIEGRPFVVGPLQFPIKGDITDYIYASAYTSNATLSEILTKISYSANEKFSELISKPLWNLHLETLKKADALVFDSQATYKLYDKILPEAVRHTEIIPPGVETDLFTFIPPKQKHHLEVLTAGSLIWNKGFQYLLRAIPALSKEFPNIKVRILGTGPCERYLKWLTVRLDIKKHVTFEGRVSRWDMNKYYANCDVYIARFGAHSALEAQSVGRPVITSELGYMPEVVSHGVTGYVIPFENVAILEETLSKLLVSSEFRLKLGVQARSRIEKEFAWNKLAEKYYSLYASLVNQ
jgi:glycosyltransferase involved in cell wall biosynthesis